MTEERIASLKDIFRFVLELTPETAIENVEQANTPKWDSMAHVSLVAGIESEFDVQLQLSEALGMTSFARCVKLLDKKLG